MPSSFAAQPQPDVGGDLVVARAPGVKALAGVADEVGQPLLDVQVHVLEVEAPLERSLLDLAADLSQSALDVGEVGRRDDAGPREHRGVGERPFDVGERETAVEPDRRGVAQHEIGHRFVESTRPGTAFRSQWIRGLRRVL